MEQEQLKLEVDKAIAAMKGDRNIHRIISYLGGMRGISYFGIGKDVREILDLPLTILPPISDSWDDTQPDKTVAYKPRNAPKPKPSSQPKIGVKINE